MPHIFIPDGIRVAFFGHGEEGQEYLHTFGVQVPEGGSPGFADCVAVNEAFYQWAIHDYHNMFASGIVITKVVSTGENSVPAAQAARSINQAGTRAGISLPSETSCFAAAYTHRNGRSNRGGQAAWPAVLTDRVSQDRFQGDYTAAIEGVFNSLAARVLAAGYTLAISSLRDGAMKPISRYIVNDDVIDSRRRRTINRGR